MVYGTQITIVFMGFINHLITGGPHLVAMENGPCIVDLPIENCDFP